MQSGIAIVCAGLYSLPAKFLCTWVVFELCRPTFGHDPAKTPSKGSAGKGTTAADDLATEAKCVKMEAFLEMHRWRRPTRSSTDPEERKLRKLWDDLMRRCSGPIGQGIKPSERQLTPQARARVERIEMEIDRREQSQSESAAGATLCRERDSDDADQVATKGMTPACKHSLPQQETSTDGPSKRPRKTRSKGGASASANTSAMRQQPAVSEGLSQRPVAMDTDEHVTPYYEIQVDAWCGMHAINNFLGGPYCTRADCRSACSQVVTALSQALGGDAEASAPHLDPETGWLSIDVINVMGAGQLGIHVEGDSMSLDAFLAQGDVAAFVNWNNQHWTLLVGHSPHGPWIHTNSFFEGQQSFHGRVETTERAHVAQILADIARHCGSYSLHRVVRARPGGDQFLEAAGRRAMLPPEEEVLPDMPAATVAETDGHERGGPQEVSVVTANVDGMGEYARSATDRIAGILEEILKVRPQFVLLQEVTIAMYVEIKRILADWQVYRRLGC